MENLVQVTNAAARVTAAAICAIIAGVGFPPAIASAAPAHESTLPSGRANPPEIVFSGLESFSEAELRKEAVEELSPVESGAGNPANVADAAYRMQSYMKSQGYPDAKVEFRLYDTDYSPPLVIRDSSDWHLVTEVKFMVHSGRKIFMGTISFPGAHAFSPDYLRALAAPSTIYRPTGIRSAIGRIQRAYVEDGYAKVRVGPARTSRRQGPSGKVYFDVAIPITEGDRYVINSVTVRNVSQCEDRGKA